MKLQVMYFNAKTITIDESRDNIMGMQVGTLQARAVSLALFSASLVEILRVRSVIDAMGGLVNQTCLTDLPQK